VKDDAIMDDAYSQDSQDRMDVIKRRRANSFCRWTGNQQVGDGLEFIHPLVQDITKKRSKSQNLKNNIYKDRIIKK